MRDRIDPLIEERAPWLFRERLTARLARRVLDRALSYDRTVALAEKLEPHPTAEIMSQMYANIGQLVSVRGLQNVPRQGPALVVANHPTGIADGIILQGALAQIRPDSYFFANRDILRVLPQMADFIAPVEWREEKRSHGSSRETLTFLHRAVKEDRLGVIFPSGRLAKRRWLKLHERPWMTSAAVLARKYDLPVIPVNIRARNSVLFYLFDLIHPTLRDITLFYETLNKDRQPFEVSVGEAISPSALPKDPEEGTDLLRRATLAMGGQPAEVSLVKATRKLALWS